MEVWIIVLSLAGLLITSYIIYKKSRNEKLVCVIGRDCNKVINSEYSSHGTPNEHLGFAYYSAMVVSSVVILAFPSVLVSPLFWARVVIVGLAAAFSVYLTVLQLFVLKELCEYCLAVNLVNVALFVILAA